MSLSEKDRALDALGHIGRQAREAHRDVGSVPAESTKDRLLVIAGSAELARAALLQAARGEAPRDVEPATPWTCAHITEQGECVFDQRTWSQDCNPTRCAGCPDREEASQEGAGEPVASLANALVMTGLKTEAELIDMANVGQSLRERIALLTQNGPFKGWTPCDDPAEIVFDLVNHYEDAALTTPPNPQARIAALEKDVQRAVDHYDLRGEMHTNDADLAATMAGILRAALNQGADQ